MRQLVQGLLWGCVLIALSSGVRGDVLHLSNGGTIEGEILAKEGEHYRVRTAFGTVKVPLTSVDRVEEVASPLTAYDERAAAVDDTPEAHFELAKWCQKHGLQGRRNRHLQQVIALAPNHAGARRMLGFVRIGNAWIKGNAAKAGRNAADEPEKASEDPAALLEEVQGKWYRRFVAIRDNLLESSLTRLQKQGRGAILDIDDPVSVVPMSRALSQGGRRTRLVLIEALKRFDNDAATMNLAVLALMDSDDTVRYEALRVLVKRDDPRVVPEYRRALFSDNDVLIRNAAEGLRALRARGAIPDLIGALTARRQRAVEQSVGEYFAGLSGQFSRPVVAQAGAGVQISVAPTIGVYTPPVSTAGAGGIPVIPAHFRVQPVTVYRTEVLEALKALTGQNFGFDAQAWQAWYKEQGS